MRIVPFAIWWYFADANDKTKLNWTNAKYCLISISFLLFHNRYIRQSINTTDNPEPELRRRINVTPLNENNIEDNKPDGEDVVDAIPSGNDWQDFIVKILQISCFEILLYAIFAADDVISPLSAESGDEPHSDSQDFMFDIAIRISCFTLLLLLLFCGCASNQ